MSLPSGAADEADATTITLALADTYRMLINRIRHEHF
jgi:hypothetical protein